MLNTDPALLSWVEFDSEKQTLLALYVLKISLKTTNVIFFF